jgi:hypothetical protein
MNPIPVRVMVEDAWDQVTLDLPPSVSIADAKQQALTLTHTRGMPEEYVVKFRGAEVFDEGRSLAESGIVANAAIIVLPRRRRPVR